MDNRCSRWQWPPQADIGPAIGVKILYSGNVTVISMQPQILYSAIVQSIGLSAPFPRYLRVRYLGIMCRCYVLFRFYQYQFILFHFCFILLIVSTLLISSHSFPTRILSVYFGLTLRPSSRRFIPRVCFGLSPSSISELFPIHYIHVLGFSFMFSFYGC